MIKAATTGVEIHQQLPIQINQEFVKDSVKSKAKQEIFASNLIDRTNISRNYSVLNSDNITTEEMDNIVRIKSREQPRLQNVQQTLFPNEGYSKTFDDLANLHIDNWFNTHSQFFNNKEQIANSFNNKTKDKGQTTRGRRGTKFENSEVLKDEATYYLDHVILESEPLRANIISDYSKNANLDNPDKILFSLADQIYARNFLPNNLDRNHNEELLKNIYTVLSKEVYKESGISNFAALLKSLKEGPLNLENTKLTEFIQTNLNERDITASVMSSLPKQTKLEMEKRTSVLIYDKNGLLDNYIQKHFKNGVSEEQKNVIGKILEDSLQKMMLGYEKESFHLLFSNNNMLKNYVFTTILENKELKLSIDNVFAANTITETLEASKIKEQIKALQEINNEAIATLSKIETSLTEANEKIQEMLSTLQKEQKALEKLTTVTKSVSKNDIESVKTILENKEDGANKFKSILSKIKIPALFSFTESTASEWQQLDQQLSELQKISAQKQESTKIVGKFSEKVMESKIKPEKQEIS